MRLYLFASVFFFFAAFWVADFSKVAQPGDIDPESAEAAREEAREAIRRAEEETGLDLGNVEAELDAAGEAAENAEGADPTEEEGGGKSAADMKWEELDYEGPDWLEPHVRRMFESFKSVQEDPRLFVSEAQKNLPRFLLLAPVIYGLTLMLLYFYRRKIFIYDHFIVSLYMHAALYTYLLAALLISRLPVVGGLWFIPLIWGAFQPIMVLRQTYGSNWLSVFIKWVLSMTVYLMAFILIITLGLSYSLYQS